MAKKINLNSEQLRLLFEMFMPGLACPPPWRIKFTLRHGAMPRTIANASVEISTPTDRGWQEFAVWAIIEGSEPVWRQGKEPTGFKELEILPIACDKRRWITKLSPKGYETIGEMVSRFMETESPAFILVVVRTTPINEGESGSCSITAFIADKLFRRRRR